MDLRLTGHTGPTEANCNLRLNAISRNSRSAFTLVELMISVVLVLLLILGVNQVFKMTSDAVGAGQSMSTIGRNNRAAQSVFYNDFQAMVPPANKNNSSADAPFFIIRSQREPAFRNPADALADLDYVPTETDGDAVDEMIRSRDLNLDNTEDTGDSFETPSVAIYDSRNHRVDRMGFFIRDLIRRQTGNDGTFVAPMSGTEAYVWYGHLKLPNFNTTAALQLHEHFNPGIDYHATSAVDALNAQSNPENFYASDWMLGRVVYLLMERTDHDNNPGTPDTIADNNGIEQSFIRRVTPGSLTPLNDGTSADGYRVEWCRYDVAETSFAGFKEIIASYTQSDPWWDQLSNYRFQGNPFPKRFFDSFGVARTVPCFIPACTQFMVEFAGDFLNQDPTTGAVLPGAPDDVVDFYIDGDIRKTMWYGFPRDTTGDRLIHPGRDVVPVGDIRPEGPFVFERELPTLTPQTEYAANTPPDALYTCVWGHRGSTDTTSDEPMPTMLRITVAIDDPNGRIGEAQTFEYVIKLP